MSVKDPDCGTCKTVTMPGGKTYILEHKFPKALKHHYPLPALDATSAVDNGDYQRCGPAKGTGCGRGSLTTSSSSTRTCNEIGQGSRSRTRHAYTLRSGPLPR